MPVDLAGLASELRTQSGSSWDFVSLQGWVLARLCGAKFRPCLLVGRGPVPNKVLWEVSRPAAPRPPATGGVSFHFTDGIMSLGVLFGSFFLCLGFVRFQPVLAVDLYNSHSHLLL